MVRAAAAGQFVFMAPVPHQRNISAEYARVLRSAKVVARVASAPALYSKRVSAVEPATSVGLGERRMRRCAIGTKLARAHL